MTDDKTYRVIGRSLVFHNAENVITSLVRSRTREAMGVVGHTPIIGPGDQFLYGSGCTLNTKNGSMSGRFHVIEDKKRSKEFRRGEGTAMW